MNALDDLVGNVVVRDVAPPDEHVARLQARFVEAMFRVPGLGSFFVSSIDNRDYPMEMALMLMITVMFCVSYILSDIAYALLNPRIRISGESR